jgi:hypothetical protein
LLSVVAFLSDVWTYAGAEEEEEDEEEEEA